MVRNPRRCAWRAPVVVGALAPDEWAMNFLVEALGIGVAVPTAVSLSVYSAGVRLPWGESCRRFAAPMAFAAAYCVAYVLMPKWAELIPSRHWHWTLYLVPAAAAIGALAAIDRVPLVVRWLVFLLAAIVSAWLFLPHWLKLPAWLAANNSLGLTPRAVYVPILTACLLAIAALVEPLGRRLPATSVLGGMALTAVCLAVFSGAMVSVMYGEMAMIAAAALVGCWVGACILPQASAARGMSLAYAVAVGGWAWIGCIEPQRPLVPLMLVPVAPLALWSCAFGRPAQLRGFKGAALHLGAVVIALALAAGLVIASSALNRPPAVEGEW